MATQLFLQPTSPGTELRLQMSAEAMLLTTRGAGVEASSSTATLTGPVAAGALPVATGGTAHKWYSYEVSTDFVISGTITCNFWGSETNMSANAVIGCTIERIGQFGETISTIAQGAHTVELAVTTRAANNFNLTPTSTNMVIGDRIRVSLYYDDSSTMASGFNVNASWGGTSAAADGDSYVSFTETFAFALPAVGPTLNSSIPTTTASASSINATLPTGYASGDLLVIVCAYGRNTNGTVTWNTPSGWNLAVTRERLEAGLNEHGIAVIWRTSDGSEGSTRSISVTSATSIATVAYAYDAGTFDTTTPIGNTVNEEEAAGNVYWVIPALTVSNAGNNIGVVASPYSGGISVTNAGCNTHRITGRTNTTYDTFTNMRPGGGGPGTGLIWTQTKISAGNANLLGMAGGSVSGAHLVAAWEVNSAPAGGAGGPPPERRLYPQLLAQ